MKLKSDDRIGQTEADKSRSGLPLSPGDRIQTKSGRLGILQSPTVNMPAHHLIRFDDGAVLWVIKEAIESALKTTSKRQKC